MIDRITQGEWIDNLCRDSKITDTSSLPPSQIKEWLDEYNQFFGGTCSEESFKRCLRKGKKNYLIEIGEYEESKPVDQELIESNVKYRKEKQKQQDINRVERKTFREYARIENAVSEYGRALTDTLTEYGQSLSLYNPTPVVDYESDEVGMIQLTDNHLNNMIDLPHNKFDIVIASRRLYKLYRESILMFKARGIKKVVVAFTGDLLSSTKRLDDLLTQANNRSKSTFVAVELYKNLLLQLSEDFHVSVVSVLGNESRVGEEMPFSNEGLSDNYDLMIVGMLKTLFESSGNQNIEFGSINEVETVIEVKGNKILLTHDVPKSSATQKNAQSLVGMKYLQGTPIDYVITGHIHSTMNQPFTFRSGSLCGANSYSDNALHLASKASQNLYFIGRGYMNALSIDLQETTEEMFDISEKVMEYDYKTLSKYTPKTTILSIVI